MVEQIFIPIQEVEKDTPALPDWFAYDQESTSEIIEEVSQLPVSEIVDDQLPNTLPDWFLVQEDELVSKESSEVIVHEDTSPEKEYFNVSDIQIPSISKIPSVQHNRIYQTSASVPIKQQIPSVQTVSEEPVFFDFNAKATEGLQKIASSLDSMDFITKSIAQHMAACNGTDGHAGKTITTKAMEEAREIALINVMNTKVGSKISSNEEISEEDQKVIEEIVSMTYQSKLGVDTTSIKESGVRLSDFSQVQAMMPEFIPPHQHGANCSHGGNSVVGSIGSSFFGGHDDISSSLFSKDDHKSHDKVYSCSSCGRNHKLHVHEGEKVPTCKCGGSLKEKKQHKH